MRTQVFRILLAAMFVFCGPSPSADAARIEDIATVYGVRDNALFGYGLVTGLNRSGDSLRNAATIRAVANRLQGLGFTLSTDDIKARNVAVVMVTGKLPAGSRPGHIIDVAVSSTGDCTSLEGGVLMFTPLYAPNGDAYASAQGPLIIGGYTATSGGSTSRKNHPTVGRVPQGGTVEMDNPNKVIFSAMSEVEWLVNDPDLITATRMADVVNTAVGSKVARAQDGGTVRVKVPGTYKNRVVELVAMVEALDVDVDVRARVVVNERTGTVVMGAGVLISPVAVAHGGLSIEVQKETEVSQPSAFSVGNTEVTKQTKITVEEAGGELVVVEGVSIGDLVSALNSMGVKPRDLIQILMTIKAAGALQADLEVL